MPLSYNLRLSDGTALVVDHDGLSTWLVDDKAMVQLVGSNHWRPLQAFFAAERAAARSASRPQPNVAPLLPLIPPPPRKEETLQPAERPPSDPEGPPFLGEAPAVQIPRESVEHQPAKEGADAAWSAEAGHRLEEILPMSAPGGTWPEAMAGTALPLSPPPSRQQETPRPFEPPPSEPVEPLFLGEPPAAQVLAVEPIAARAEFVSHQSTPNDPVAPIRLKPVDDEVYPPTAASPWSEPLETRSSLLVLADNLESPNSRNAVETSPPDDALPIRLKPRDHPHEAHVAVEPTAHEPQPWHDPRDEKLFQTVATFGGFLSGWLRRLDRQLGRLPSISRGRALHVPTTSEAREAPPSFSEPPRLAVLAEEPTGPSGGFTRGKSTPGQVLSILPPMPPASISDLPILRLAELNEPSVAQDVYEGESVSRTAWLWTKRVVVITGLLAGGIFASVTRETWLPKAARFSRIFFTEIDKQARSRDQTEHRQQALQAATEQLPHLAPDTIQLVLSGGVLDPPEVFRLACDAADRGLPALVPGEAQELRALKQQMLDTLRPEERQRARDYDRARGRRPTLPLEDSEVLELFARGARALPPANRARLQVLSGKVIAAGLVQDAPVGLRRPETD
jgi:hypothetical protein